MVNSLCYNSLTNSDVVMDSLMETHLLDGGPTHRWFGAVFVCLVVILTSSILLIAYPPRPPPGYPPTVKNDIPFVSVCKKCIIPKPARTHHCGNCNTCILKMDHHCPWLNNCVGHFNQRYFFCFCLSMTLGCVYCSISGRNLFLDAYSAIERFKHMDLDKSGVPVTGMGQTHRNLTSWAEHLPDPSSSLHVQRQDVPQEYHLHVGVNQHCGCSSGGADYLARSADIPRERPA
ncbi:hypothetical protein J4Q44_G00009010 [Coregonus suidteri]|uniref:Palmitoyltransferase n=1 Tax=Coregonus suidteri TaxID=861788 RepID=A0AAN8R999_9TELE